jgi:hypothetical protein
VVFFYLFLIDFIVEYAFCIGVDVGEKSGTISLERSPSLVQRPMEGVIMPLTH